MTTVSNPIVNVDIISLSDRGIQFGGGRPALPLILDGGDAFTTLFTIIDGGSATDIHLPENTIDGGQA